MGFIWVKRNIYENKTVKFFFCKERQDKQLEETKYKTLRKKNTKNSRLSKLNLINFKCLYFGF